MNALQRKLATTLVASILGAAGAVYAATAGTTASSPSTPSDPARAWYFFIRSAVARIASGEDPKNLTAVLDLVEASVRQQTPADN